MINLTALFVFYFLRYHTHNLLDKGKPNDNWYSKTWSRRTIDLAYDIFLEMAGENLDPADIMLFNLQFEDRGAVEFVETADDWEQEIGVLIDPEALRWSLGRISEWERWNGTMCLQKFLISHREEDREFHVIWKK